ncbi:MAG: penicillin-binding protein 2, partial [Pseudomonadota bacterium]|nr:penicillin-binding protein 2 [Pseudomonadota bacterium]
MTTADPHALRRKVPRWGGGWLKARVWAVERAFERNRAADHAVDDTRLRIFVVFTLFATLFLALAVGASKAALSGRARDAASAPVVSSARAELADRRGSLLALDLMHYGLYLDAREVWDKEEIRRGLQAALPNLSAPRL